MNRKQARRALKKVAKKYGVSVAEVKQEIEFAAEVARKNANTATQACWVSASFKGDKPTATEVVVHLSERLKNTRQ